jgi:hypothetical protein
MRVSGFLFWNPRNNQQAHQLLFGIILSSNQFQETTRRCLNIGGRVMRFPKLLLKKTM